MIQNGYNVATMANSTLGGFEDWSSCVGCAVLSRSWARNGDSVPQACQQCFTKYCWNGTLSSSEPQAYAPSLKLAAIDLKSAASVSKFVPGAWGVGVAAVVAGLLVV